MALTPQPQNIGAAPSSSNTHISRHRSSGTEVDAKIAYPIAACNAVTTVVDCSVERIPCVPVRGFAHV
jgi:hypothetical protein